MPKTNQSGPDGGQVIRLRGLKDRGDTAFDLVPTAAELAALAAELGLSAIRKLRLKGSISGLNTADWQLNATLGATVVQPCVVTGVPVSSRLDVPVRRLFIKDFHLPDSPGDSRFDGQDDLEPLTDTIDLAEIATESLALNIPEYPRAPDAELGEAVFAAPGITPMRDEDVKPFAALAALRDKSPE